jgi:hypothetical protein
MGSHAPNDVEAAQRAVLHGEIDDYHIGAAATKKPIAGGQIACLEHGSNAGIFKHAPQSL